MADTVQFESLGGRVPFSAEAEQSVLGSILIDAEAIHAVSEIIKNSEYFYLPQHKEIYRVLTDMALVNERIDPVTVLEALKKRGVYDDAGGKAYLMQLVEMVPSAANVEANAGIVRDKYFARALLDAGRTIVRDVEEESSEVNNLIDLAEQRIYDIRQGRDVSGLTHIREVLHGETILRLERLNNPETRGDYIGIPTGINRLDRMMTGLNKSDLIIIGARPGMGKTSFVLNIARNVAVKEGKKVCFFSLEMSRDQVAQRLLSSEACIKSEQLRTGKLVNDEWTRLIQATEILSKANLYVDESTGITVPEMKSKVRRLGDVDLVIIDYLGLMELPRDAQSKGENRVQEVTKLTRSLKLMAKELNIPVICCSQLRRAASGDKESNRPSLSSLRDSGSIEQDADIVLFLHREDYYKSANPEQAADEHSATCIVAKNRHGETGDVDLYWDGQFTRFTAVEKDDR